MATWGSPIKSSPLTARYLRQLGLSLVNGKVTPADNSWGELAAEGINVGTNKVIQLRDSGICVYSPLDGQLNLVADGKLIAQIGLSGGNPAEAFRVDGVAGNMNIGGTAVAEKLSVEGNVRALDTKGYQFGDENTAIEGSSSQDYIRVLVAGAEVLRIDPDGNIGFKTTNQFGGGVGVMSLKNAGTNPGSNPTDAAIFYSADVIAGKASIHLKNEAGDVIKAYKETAYTQTYATADKTHANPVAAAVTDNSTGTIGTTLAAGAGISVLAIPVDLVSITAAGDVLTNYTLGFKFKILAVHFHVTKPVTTAAKAATLNLEIGTVDLTGGTVALTSANCTPLGVQVAGSAITGANTGSATDTISIEAASVTAFAEGQGVLLVRIQNMDTADAVASLADQHNKNNTDILDAKQIVNALIDDLQAQGWVG